MREFSTPMMQQYIHIRQQYADCMLFFRLGDFYELFLEDALEGAKILGITLTRRPRGKDGDIPMAGVPFHSADTYIAKLLRAGKKIAICEQVSEPDSKGIVDRKVVRIITPGTVVDDRSLEQKKHNYLMSIQITKRMIGVAWADVLTGDFFVTEFERTSQVHEELGAHLLRFSPSECVVSESTYNSPEQLGLLTAYYQPTVSYFSDWESIVPQSAQKVAEHFLVASVGSFGITHLKEATTAAAVLIAYIDHTQQSKVTHLNKPKVFVPEDYVLFDPATVANLEIFSTLQDNSSDGSLLAAVDKTQTAMGGRLLRSWVLHPQKNKKIIEDRYDVIEWLYHDSETRLLLQTELAQVLDLERLISKLALGVGSIASILNIHQCLQIFTRLYPQISTQKLQLFHNWKSLPLRSIQKLIAYIEKTITEEVTATGEVVRCIQAGVNSELDQLRQVQEDGKSWIATFEKSEKERTGITTLKCRFNSVFGYYIEVSQSQLGSIPSNYIRKQTLVNAERFITPELKNYEEKILSAEERIAELEREIFVELETTLLQEITAIKQVAQSIAELDVLCGFAQIALERRYCRPTIIEEGTLSILEGKHPVLEQKLHENFVPNDTLLNQAEHQLLVITGPNMAGKSVYMRQVAILVLLAQAGSFIPATAATIPIVDRIFVRSGAADNISRGLSTFMVEMVEAATILNQATNKSLVIMDEIGRGTSTYDGISIAWAIAEYLVTHPSTQPKVLFATHYHELQELADTYPTHIQNYQVLVEEHEDVPVFLYTVAKGAAPHSFGIAVAKLAGLPQEILDNAQNLLAVLESNSQRSSTSTPASILSSKRVAHQKNNTRKETIAAEVVEKLSSIDLSTTTPVDALIVLDQLQKILKNSKNK